MLAYMLFKEVCISHYGELKVLLPASADIDAFAL